MSCRSAPLPGHNLERSVQIIHTGRAFALLAAVQVTLILAITVIAIALPAVARDLALRPGQLALVSAGYGLAFSGLLLLGGRLADQLGPRRMLVSGLVAFGLASAAAGLAPGFGALLASRLAQGAGAALAAPAAMALLGSVFPDRDRHARAVAVWGSLAPVGATSGILLSGFAVTWASWRWAFAVPVAVAAVAVLAARRLLPAPAPSTPTRLDLPGALLVTFGVGTLAYGLFTAGDHGWTAPWAVAAMLAGAVALAGFAVVETRTRSPLLPLRFLRSPDRLIGLTAVLVAAAGHASIGFFLALYLQQVRGMSSIATTAAFLPFLAMLPLAGAIASRLVTRMQAHTVAATGLATGAAGLLLIGQLGAETPYVGTLLAGMLIFPAGAALTFAGATVVAVEGTEQSRAGLAGGLVNTAVELGPTIGLAILVSLAGTRTAQLVEAGAGAAAATSGGYSFALTAAAIAFGAAAALVGFARWRSPASRRSMSQSPHPTTNENQKGDPL